MMKKRFSLLAQVSGVMITREDFMVSVYDYNKDAEDAEKAEKAAAASGPSVSPSSPRGLTLPAGERCLSDRNDSWGPGTRYASLLPLA